MDNNSDFIKLNADKMIKDATLPALEKARMYHTNLIVERNGRVIELTPDEFEISVSAPRRDE